MSATQAVGGQPDGVTATLGSAEPHHHELDRSPESKQGGVVVLAVGLPKKPVKAGDPAEVVAEIWTSALEGWVVLPISTRLAY